MSEAGVAATELACKQGLGCHTTRGLFLCGGTMSDDKPWTGRMPGHGLTDHQRFWEKVDTSGDCWEWKGGKPLGYGRFYWRGGDYQAHRASLLLAGVEIPEGKFVLHHCDNPSCVRPSHLYIGTHNDNMRDMARRGRAADTSGENHPQVKMTARKVRWARKAFAAGGSLRQIAKRFGVSHNCIYEAVKRKTWKNI